MSHEVGKTWRNDAYAKVTGRAKYVDDMSLPGMVHAVPVYADFLHAELKSVQIDEALAMPGVLRVLTARDVPGNPIFGQILKDYRMLVNDRIRCAGDVLAIVVAETRAQALSAVAKVRVEADPLPPILDPLRALEPDCPLVHEGHGSNLINEHKVRRGEPEKAFASCDLILEEDFRTQMIEHAYLEPEAALCWLRDDGVMEVHGSLQHPFSARRFVATLIGFPLHRVEVIGNPMGGGFGGKDDTASIVCARAALVALLTGRPTKMTYEREWSVRESYKRHPYQVHYKMGLTRDGVIQACDIRIVADGGAYCSVTPWVTWRSTVQCCGPYTVPNVHCDTFGVYTNNPYTGAMRGFGSPQLNFIVESMVEMAAEKLGLDAIEIRRKNMVQQGSTTITGQVLDDHTVSLEEALNLVLQEIGYEEKLARCSHGHSDSDELYGIGLAISYRGMSLGAEGVDACSAAATIQPDGTVVLETGIHENGQGSDTTMILVLAEEMGIDPDQIQYRRSSTSTIPDSGTTVASRGTLMGGSATALVARKLKAQMAETLAPDLDCDPTELSFSQGRIASPTGASLGFNEAVRMMYQRQVHPSAVATFQAPQVSWDEETGQGKAYFTWVYACQAAEVSVHKKTGKVKVLNLVCAHDVGKAINPGMVLGQMYGGLAMGMGYGLIEEVLVEDGRITNLNFNKLKVPRALDLPEMKAMIIQHADPNSTTGAKGVGEPTLEITAPALANAIYRATGQRLKNLPLRPSPLS